MKAIAFHQLTALSSAVGLGFTVAGAAAYDAGTAYSVGTVVTYGGYSWACITAGTGQTPAAGSTYWIQVNATSGIPVDAIHILAIGEVQDIRYREDGRAPTASVGMILPKGDGSVEVAKWFETSKLSDIKVIEETTSAKLNLTYYGS